MSGVKGTRYMKAGVMLADFTIGYSAAGII